jgi:hypothetical protein
LKKESTSAEGFSAIASTHRLFFLQELPDSRIKL